MSADDRLPPVWDAQLPGERIEGTWRGERASWQGRALGCVQTADGPWAVHLTSVLARRVAAFPDGQPVRVTYCGLSYTQAGRPYRRLEIEPLLEDELPDRAPAPRELRPGEQATLW